MALSSLLQLLQHKCSIPFIQHELDIDPLAAKFVACLIAANSTMPQVCKRDAVHSRKHQAWFDSNCKQALNQKEAVFKDSHSTTEQKVVAEKIFKPVTERLKEGLELPAQCRAV